ncbi:TIGR00730 family Rossman fold protein [Spongiibacter sp. KMU-166]|uniref:Cytokinin riboside 5'-monophosphate phosphoribohydrolase n=1 Tax=Spongiibacter thalassae TaxID=2721624 RepID=A0ABX1GGA3_9GAMM|nr:TIGR00730 family Rossman fold protein [Spongiibacter thalassae]NKI18242.1 TIGR00730 family Rossman fold protein [Spongiibacter thalassae]
MQRICVYCGSGAGRRDDYRQAARRLASALVERNIGLVYGGASIGIMGELADAVIAEGGEVIGVIPQDLADREVAHAGLSELRVVATMHQRKQVMAELADGFIALPGGLGTLEELFEILTWAQLGYHRKPCALLNVAGYYDHLSAFLQHGVAEQFVSPAHARLLQIASDVPQLLATMEQDAASR